MLARSRSGSGRARLGALAAAAWLACAPGRPPDDGVPGPTDPLPDDGAEAPAQDRPPVQERPVPPTPPPAPWSGERLPAAAAPRVLLEQWRAADNRATCAPLAPVAVTPPDAAPRAATFAGGWGVAWDLPQVRSAFGIAGTGVSAHEPRYGDWPHRRVWSDGSTAAWGPEGGTGPNQLAYLQVAGEDCLYNVWSRLGAAHLETLLARLRRIAAGG